MPSVDDEFQADSVLCVEMPRRAAPQAAFADVYCKGDAVCEVGFRFERHRAAVDESILVREPRPVEKHLVTPVHSLVPRESRAADIDEENLSRVGKEVVVESSLRRELRRRDAALLIGVVSLQVLAAEHPLASAFGVGRERSPETVPCFGTVGVRIEPVGHARFQLNAPHLGEASLGVSPPHTEGERRYEDD